MKRFPTQVMLAALLASALASPAALAQTTKEKAAAIFREANALHSRGMYLDALKKYRQANKIFPSFKIDLNIGGTLDAMGRHTDAARYFERFLINSSAAPPEITKVAEKRLEELKRKVASLKLSCLQAGATVKVDGKSVGQTPLELRLYLKAGSHLLSVEKEGFVPFAKTLEVSAGVHGSLDVPLKKVGAADQQQKGAEDLARQRRNKTLGAHITLGAAMALAVTASALYCAGMSQSREPQDLYRTATDPQEILAHWEDVQSANNTLIAGHVLAGTAAAALGVSIYLYLTRPDAGERPDTTSQPTLGLATGRNGAVVSFSTSF